MQRVIGIDYGTSTTYMNVKRYNGGQPVEDKFSYMPVVFNYGESSGYVSSIVRENGDGTFDFGEKAAEPLEGATVYTEIKMRLESPDESKRTEARRITREFFKFLYATYTQQASSFGSPDDTEETVISYPVKWRKETAEFMLDAARSAGFRNVRGMDEATAAVSTVLCQSSDGKSLIYADKPGYLMLIDMGAGTTDLVICKYAARTGGGIDVELVTNWPQSADEPTFGGREIDAVLEKYVEEYLAKSLNPALAPQAHIIAAAPGQAKMWKERNVSASLAANKPVNTCAYIGTYRTMGMLTGDFPSFDRKGFEETAAQGLRDYVRLLEGCLAEAAKKDEAFADAGVDLVILTGGHSAWYFAREIIDGTMEGWLDHPALTAVRENKYRVVSLPNPQTTVSLGLIYSKLSFKLEKRVEPNVTYHDARPRQKEVIRQSATQIHKIEENESFDDAFNRFKKQTKEAQHQQEVPIKPAQTGGRVYRWDDRLLLAAKSQSAQTSRTVENESFDAAMKRFNKQAKDAKQQQKAPVTPAKKEGRTVPASGKSDWESIIRQVIVMTQITSDPRTNKNTDTLRQVCQVRGGETVLLSFDNTTVQNGKGGVVLTDRAIYTRQWPFSPERYLWKDFAKCDPCQASFGGINVGHIGIPYCSEAFHDFIWSLNQHMKR